MKKLITLTIIMMMAFLVACSPAAEKAAQEEVAQDTMPEPTPEPEPEMEVEEETTQEPIEVEEPEPEPEPEMTTYTQETYDTVEELLELPAKRIVLSDAFRKYERGEKYVHLMGINNHEKTQDYRVEFEFDGKRDRFGNLQDDDEELVLQWFEGNIFGEDFEVEKGKFFHPIPVKVAEEAEAGNYVFKFRIYHQADAPTTKHEFGLLELTIQVD